MQQITNAIYLRLPKWLSKVDGGPGVINSADTSVEGGATTVLIKNAKLKLSQINNILEKKPPMDSIQLKKSIQESSEILILPNIKKGDQDYERVSKYYLKREDPAKIDSIILKNSISVKSL